MKNRVEIVFSKEEGFCYGCKFQSASTSSTLQIIGMVITNQDGTKRPLCYSCGIKRIEGLKEELLATRNV